MKNNIARIQELETKILLVVIILIQTAAFVIVSFKSENTLTNTTEYYTNLLVDQEADITESELPYKKLGKYNLSWYSPKELGKEKASQLKTSTGTIPKEGRTIAVDPKVIPYGSIIYIQGYGYYIAEDCGGDIKNNRIDIFVNNYDDAIGNGRRAANVYLLGRI